MIFPSVPFISHFRFGCSLKRNIYCWNFFTLFTETNPNADNETELGYGSIINLTPQEQGSWLKQCKQKIFRKKTIYQRLPVLKWLPNYTIQDLLADLVAGISVGVTLIPQALAYATVAGLPPEVYRIYVAAVYTLMSVYHLMVFTIYCTIQ